MPLNDILSIALLALAGGSALAGCIVFLLSKMEKNRTDCLQRDSATRELLHSDFQTKIDATAATSALHSRMKDLSSTVNARHDRLDEKMDRLLDKLTNTN